jgi:carbon storage regulator CsrA
MLILSREVEESVELFDSNGKKIGEVKVVQVIGGKVRLGFSADKSTQIFRSEIAKDAMKRHGSLSKPEVVKPVSG